MEELNDRTKTHPELEDTYFAYTRELVDLYLAEHHLNRAILRRMPDEKAKAIIRQALDFAAQQMTRREAMIRLGTKDSDAKMDEQPHHHHGDRLRIYFSNK